MDSAADSLIALSNTATAVAERRDIEEDDDRSSSLSELEEDDQDGEGEDEEEDEEDEEMEDDEPEDEENLENFKAEPAALPIAADAESEAETERLEESPDKLPRTKSFGTTPSKLIQNHNIDERPEIESLTDSAISSPMSSQDDSDELSDAPAIDEDQVEAELGLRSPTKRKRELDEEQDQEEQERSRRRRTGSIASDDNKSDVSNDVESPRGREATTEPVDPALTIEMAEDEDNKVDRQEDQDSEEARVGRPSRRRGRNHAADGPEPVEDDAENAEDSDDAELDDADVVAKSEEEQAEKVAAVDTLQSHEQHFASLRDCLYDERIAAINQELEQLAQSIPTHSELLKQVEAVRKYRDEKFDAEQKLLLYKIGALKNKSVAERSTAHSQYFQTVRDIRERHQERLSELFYRIQRDRFKMEAPLPSYTIPFPDKRATQIAHQTSYNLEVSITSGIAKYVGFPAAPDLAQIQQKEIDEDLEKLGISTTVRVNRPIQRLTSGYSPVTTGPTTDFLEKNPWANPNHPANRLALSRQNSNRSPMNETYSTPAQQRTVDPLPVAGSASTIAEHPSAQASSAWNTPHDNLGSQTKPEPQLGVNRLSSMSPLDTRRAPPTPSEPSRQVQVPEERVEPTSSQVASRVMLTTSPSRPMLGLPDGVGHHQSASPSQRPVGIAAGGGGYNRLGGF